MNKRMAKILAVVSSTTAVGVMPLLGANISEVAYSDQQGEIGNGIIDVLYDSSLMSAENTVDTSNIDVNIVAAEEEIEQQIETVDETEEMPEIKVIDSISISGQNGFKSYMSYSTITSSGSNQYKLQSIAYTGDYGIRMVDDRFCIAVGTALDVEVGTYVDLILKNEMVIHCIVGDIKADQHTLSDNITTASNGCVSEFIVDGSSLNSIARQTGNISDVNESWDSAVVGFDIYDYNALKE